MSLFDTTPYLGYVKDTSLNNFSSKLQLGCFVAFSMKHSFKKCRFPHRKYTVLYSVHVQWPIGHVYFCMVTWNVYFGVKKMEHQAAICYRNCLMMYLQHIQSRGWCRITTLSFRGVNICQNCTIRILNDLYLGYYLSNVYSLLYR